MDLNSNRPNDKDREQLVSLSLDMLCVAGLDGYFKRLNPAFERILGFSTEELLAVPFIEFVHPEDREATQAEVKKLSEGEEVIAFENRYRCQDGSYRWLLWTATPDLDSQLLYAAARDITHQKHNEEKIREQAALLNVATDAILTCDLDGQITFWNRSAENALVKQVLAFANGVEGERQVLQIRHIIVELQRILEETLPRQIKLTVDINDNLHSIYGDSTQVYQVLMNLCVNARDAMAKGGQLQIKAHK